MRFGFLAVEFLGVLGSGELEAGGHHVDDVAPLFGDGARLGLEAGGPMHDGGRAGSAVVDVRLVAAHGSVLGVCPVVAYASVGHGAAHGDVELVAHGDGLAGFLGLGEDVVGGVPAVATEVFGAGPVVVKVDDEGIVELLGFLEGSDDRADGLVHVVDHGGVDRHVADAPWFVIYGVPWFDAALQRWKGPAFLVDNAHFEHAGVALVAQFLPAAFIRFDIFLDGFLGGVDGPVGGGERDVLKERFVGLGECLDLAGSLHAYPVGIVVVFLVDLRELGVAGQGVRVEEGTGPGHGAVEIVEAALNGAVLGGVSAEVPLAHHAGLVACRLEELGYGDLAVAEAIAVNPAEEGGPGGPAAGGVVELGEAETVFGQLVEVRGVDFAAEATEVGESHVVGQDDDDVGAVVGVGQDSKVEEEQEGEECFHGGQGLVG